MKKQKDVISLYNYKEHPFSNLIGQSVIFRQVLEKINRISEIDVTVLIGGESGTGKELVAKAIHYSSLRKNGPLVVVNCSAIPIFLIESELFGHEKGSFTDAKEKRIGRFEQAHEGTLFLDEIGELSLEAQVKLLRVIEEKKIRRLGGKEDINVDIRLITATNKNLYEEVQNRTFRLDLLYRLNIFSIVLPPLRERKEDIPLLINYFIEKYNAIFRTNISGCDNKVFAFLQNYSWPGNIRDLENAVQSALILCKGNKIRFEHLPDRIKSTTNESYNWKELEREIISEQLISHKFNKTETAKAMGISRKTLFNKIKKYEIKY